MSGQYQYIPPQPPLGFTLGIIGGFGALTGLLTAQGDVGLMPLYLVVGSLLFSAFGLALLKSGVGRGLSGWVGVLVFLAVRQRFDQLPIWCAYGSLGIFIGRMVLWLDSGRYRLPLPPYASSKEVLWFYTFRTICGAIFVFLITPIIILIPLSFNQEPYFSFTPGMLALDPAAFSTRWYWDILQNGMVDPEAITGWWSDVWNNAQWVRSVRNSFYIGIFGNIPCDCIGTLAAIGLSFERYAMA
jgi:putative spermidine/putrescine transport system permease protein